MGPRRFFHSPGRKCVGASSQAFTLTELLVVVCVAFLLVLLAVASMADGQIKVDATGCLYNLRQMTTAWLRFAEDHDGIFPAAGPNQLGPDWTDGTRRVPGAEANSPLWPYTPKDFSIWHCPADRSVPRITSFTGGRSYSMNTWMGGPGWGASGPVWRVFRKLSDIIDPTPAKASVLIDEHELSINDGVFSVDMTGYPNNTRSLKMVDFPASWHNGSAGVSFADGHGQMKKWRDARTLPVAQRGQQLRLNVPSPDNVDVIWLQEVSTRRIQ